MLFPLMKACFANSMNDRETKTLLASTSLMSLVCLFVGQNQYRVGWNWGVCLTHHRTLLDVYPFVYFLFPLICSADSNLRY